MSTLVFLAFILIYFHKALRPPWIVQNTSIHVVPGEGLTGTSEDVYQGYPPFYFAARELRQGRLPLWTPYACGGTPFVGKQQTRVFSPFHVFFYLSPTRYFQHLWLALFLLYFYFAWIFTFLLARWYGADFAGSVFAAACYTFSCSIAASKIECGGEASTFTPALFFMAEQFLGGERARARLFLPWLIALPVLCGHFQTAFLAWEAVGIYVLASLALDRSASREERWNSLWAFLACAGLGLALAGGQIATAVEYVAHSYTKVWRDPADFGWFLSRIPKRLSAEDFNPVLTGLLSAGVFIFCLKKLRLRETGPEKPGNSWMLSWAVGAASLGLSLACLMNVGMASPVFLLSYLFSAPLTKATTCLAVFLVYLLALSALSDGGLPRGLKIISWLILFGLVLYMKTPLAVHAFYDMPIYRNFYLDRYRTILTLGLALLAGYGLCRLERLLRAGWTASRNSWISQAKLVLLVLAGFASALALEDPVADWLGMGINPQFLNEKAAASGGITDAGKILTFRKSCAIRGWAAGGTGVQGAEVGLYAQGQPSFVPASLYRDGERIYFKGRVPLPTGLSVPVARLRTPQGSALWRGSDVERIESPPVRAWAAMALLLAWLALLPFIPIKKGAAAFVAFLILGVHVLAMGREDVNAGVRDNLTSDWPAVAFLKQDRDLYRIYSFDGYLWPPELSGIHGISDIRNGGDNLDVLTMIHFLQLSGALFGQDRGASQDWGSRILGLANVKYLLSRPKEPLSAKGFKLAHSGEDMLVYANERFRDRFRFFDRWKFIDGKGLDRWREGRQVLAAVHQGLLNRQLDLDHEVLLHEYPASGPPAAQGPGHSGAVKILAHRADRDALSVEADTPGFLFIASNHFPGWKAYVDGQPAEILRSWITFSSVPVPAGKHLVHLLYHSGFANFWLSLSALAAIFWSVWWWRSRRGKPDTSDPAETLLSGLVGAGLLFWLNWCVWVCGGGILPKVAALAGILFSHRSLSSFGYMGYPYAMGAFEGWPMNLIASLILAVLASAVAGRLLKRPSHPAGG